MAEQDDAQVQVDPQIAILTDILNWSKDRPEWIRDALRLLVTKPGGLEQDDILRLVSICKAESGIPNDQVQAEFFDKDHIVAQQSPSETVSLVGIKKVAGVNALAENTKLDFEPTGINLVYGDNGAGKTSYTRVLKQNCRCAAPSSIQSNAYEAPTQKKATISYLVDKDQYEFVWNEDAVCPAYLGAIRIFDSRCADVYVNKEREASFTPYGLGILSHLADNICSEVKATLLQEKEALIKQLPDLSQMLPEQQARDWVTRLNAETRPPEIDSWTQFTNNDEAELRQLQTVLAVQDPQQRIVALQAQITRINQLAQAISTVEQFYSIQGIGSLRAFVDDRDQKRQTANTAVANAFGNTPVQGTGSQEWKQLWDSARNFVESVAYPDANFPNTERCPLCQQGIGVEAQSLMNRFEEYVKGDVEAQAQAAQVAADNYWGQLQQVPLATAPYAPLLNELGPDITTIVEAFYQSAEVLKNSLPNAIQQKAWEQLPVLAVSPHQTLLNLIPPINAEIEALKQRANPEQRLAQQNRLKHLSSRRVLQPNKEAIKLEVQRLLLIANYDAAIASCNPVSISRKSGTLAEAYVTPELQKAFNHRLSQLFGDRSFVELKKTKTSVGVTFFRLKLANAVENIPIIDVASEGEFRAIALAAFLAEVDLAQDSSGIVFDDPVSSLDHRFRERFAEIVREVALSRQVVVFTHDIFFLSCITYWANRSTPKQTPACTELVSISGKHGYPQEGVPMEVRNFKARRKHILEEVKAAKKCLEATDIQGCMRIANSLTPEMRKVTERAVEEVLFNGAVVRYDPAIHTNHLHPRLTTIIEEDIKFIVSLMARYSLYPHDQAPQRKPEQPDIGVIESDIEALQAWVTDYKKRA